MELKQRNVDLMSSEFVTISEDSGIKEAFEAIMANLEANPDSPGLIVIDKEGRYAGVVTMDGLMDELSRLYGDACDKPGTRDWADAFFNQCEIVRLDKISKIKSGEGLTANASDSFDKGCQLLLDKKLNMLAVVDEASKVVGVITRRKVLAELAPKMFK